MNSEMTLNLFKNIFPNIGYLEEFNKLVFQMNSNRNFIYVNHYQNEPLLGLFNFLSFCPHFAFHSLYNNRFKNSLNNSKGR